MDFHRTSMCLVRIPTSHKISWMNQLVLPLPLPACRMTSWQRHRPLGLLLEKRSWKPKMTRLFVEPSLRDPGSTYNSSPCIGSLLESSRIHPRRYHPRRPMVGYRRSPRISRQELSSRSSKADFSRSARAVETRHQRRTGLSQNPTS